MVMTVAAGIELLGTISFDSTTLSRDGVKHFRFFWTEWLYPSEAKRRQLADVVYQLARHGIAHYSLARPRITVTRLEEAMDFHLLIEKGTSDTLIVDAPTLASDFELAYSRWKADVDMNSRLAQRCQRRLDLLQDVEAKTSAAHRKLLRRTPRAAMPIPQSRVVSTGLTDISSPAVNAAFTSFMTNLSTRSHKP
jgi:hypothetical protein